MTKLPFFKFTIAEWMLGRIQRLPLDTKGAFVDLMCMYWHNECHYSVSDAETDIGYEHIEDLVNRGIIHIEDTNIIIEFLDAQFSDCKDVSKVRSDAGRLGGLAKAKQLPSKKKQTRQDKSKKRLYTPPTVDDVIKYFELKGYKKESAIKAFEYYDVNDWVDAHGNPVKSWKQKMIAVWFKPENLKKGQLTPEEIEARKDAYVKTFGR